MSKTARIAIIGAGLGGATAAALLQRAGFDVHVFEQARAFDRIGAGIHLSPNLMSVARHLGVDRRLIDVGTVPDAFVSRAWDSGEILFELPLGDETVQRYGAPYLTVHRGDLHAALVSAVSPSSISYGRRLAAIDPKGKDISLHFDDGTSASADLVIGADGVSSRVREILTGPARHRYIGNVAHRCMVPMARITEFTLRSCTKWWGRDRHILIYFLDRDGTDAYVVSSCPDPNWTGGVSGVPCDPSELQSGFADFHPEVRHIISQATSVTKWPIYDVDTLDSWSCGNVVLLGDACHATRPYMAMGAAMAIEDGAILARCIVRTGIDHAPDAFALYEKLRIPRVKRVQSISNKNTFLRAPEDPTWAFRYDACTMPLELAE